MVQLHVRGRSGIVGLLAAALVLVIVALSTDPAIAANSGFVVAQDREFVTSDLAYCTAQLQLPPCPFRFVGTNAYFMTSAATAPSAGGTIEAARMMDLAAAAGFTVLRTWGFKDGSPANFGGEPVLQGPAAGQYGEAGFAALDYVLAQADAKNVRLIVTLVNNWSDYGGIAQYLQWCDTANHGKVAFFTEPQCKNLYKRYVYTVVNRANKQRPDLRPNRDDPTVFAWELMNEPRCSECANLFPSALDKGTYVRDWLEEMACFIKSPNTLNNGCPNKDDHGTNLTTCGQPPFGVPPDPFSVPCGAGDGNHMVATGEEGFDCTKTKAGVSSATGYTDTGNIKLHPWIYDGSQGTCYTQNSALPGIDFASLHLWPDSWGLRSNSPMLWITDHVKIAKSGSDSVSGLPINKPVVLGEFGSGKGDRTRGPLFDAWLTEVDRTYVYGSGDGALTWQMICDVCTNYASRLETVYPPPSAVSGVLCGHARTAGGVPVDSGSYRAAC